MVTGTKNLGVRHHEDLEQQFNEVRSIEMVIVLLAKVGFVTGLDTRNN